MDYSELRRCKTARPDLPGVSGRRRTKSRIESHWDAWDPVVQARAQNIDSKHWSLMRAEARANYEQLKSGQLQEVPSSVDKLMAPQRGEPSQSHNKGGSETPKQGVSTHLSPLPWSPSWLAKLNTGYNQRAREGFVYWYTPRPKPTPFGKYSLGAKHMQYGLCMAPRS